MFLSQTTLEGWRITFHSIIELTEELLNAGFITVLTGKFNQNTLEVNIFTIICYFFNYIIRLIIIDLYTFVASYIPIPAIKTAEFAKSQRSAGTLTTLNWIPSHVNITGNTLAD